MSSSSIEAHEAAVKAIARQVRGFSQRQKPFRIYHGSTNSTRASDRRADNIIDTSQLDHVLSVSKATMTAVVEPNVPMDRLVQATLQHGLIPPVVMEFPGITVGGGFSGTSGESSSFRHGAFDTNIAEIEIVLPDGTVTRASKKERTDIFWGAASAFGTLGVVTLLEMELLPATKFVRLQYTLCRSADESVIRMRRACDNDDNDFVDAIVFDQQATLLCVGRRVDELPAGETPKTFTARGDPWFYTHAEQVRRRLVRQAHDHGREHEHQVVDYIPLTDYLFRYDRGGFWVGRHAFAYFITPFNRVTRYLVDFFMHTRVMYRALHHSGLADMYMVQDVGVPYDRAAEFQAWLHDIFGLYPLWLCPLRIHRTDPDSAHGLHSEFADPRRAVDLVNFGVWGPLDGVSRRQMVGLNRALEAKVQQLGGKKWLYAHAYYTEDEFWQNYDRHSYEALRSKYGADYLPSVWDKVKVDIDGHEAGGSRGRGTWWARCKTALADVWPLRGLVGFFYAAVGGDYLMKK